MIEKLKIVFSDFGMEKLYAYAGPIGSPMPSAFTLGMILYDYMIKSFPAHPTAALIASIGGIIGIESTGALSAILVSKAYVNKDKKTTIGASVVLVAYIAFVALGIYTDKNSIAMVSTVFITLLCYLIQALWHGMREQKAQVHTQYEEGLENKKLDVQIEKQRTAQIRASARMAKMSNVQPKVYGVQTVQPVQALNSETLAKVCEHLAANPKASVRDVLKIPNIGFTSPDTANRYKHAAEEMLK